MSGPESRDPALERFWEAVQDRFDAALGAEPLSDEEIARRLDEAEPSPLDQATVQRAVERAVERVAPMPVAQASAPRPQLLSIRRILPIVALVAALTATWMIWDGLNPTRELSFEQAVDVIFDPQYDLEPRNSALGRVYMQTGVIGETLADIEDPALRGAARIVLDRLPAAFTDPDLDPDPAPWPLAVDLDDAVDTSRRIAQRAEAIARLAIHFRYGVAAIRRAEALPGMLGSTASLHVGELASWVDESRAGTKRRR